MPEIIPQRYGRLLKRCLLFVTQVCEFGKSRIAGGAIICPTSNSFPMANGLRTLPVIELESGKTHPRIWSAGKN